jgi:uncharacterized protein YbaR (Trm112 family)/SAM-dependent methyltransferase
MRLEQFADLLACPATREPLTLSDDGQSLRASGDSGRAYRVESGVPILLTPEDEAEFQRILGNEGKAMTAEYEAEPPPPDASAASEPPPPEFPPMVLPRDIIDAAYDRKGEDTRVLSVGGGPARNSPREINLNMAPFREVDAVGNATRLPFRSDSVDAVWSNAVLEHVAGAPEAVAEMIRVVEPGGVVMNLVPFMQPVHAYPLDFQRYTADGLAHLMRDLDILAKGQAVGPSYAMLELLTRYLNGPGMVCLPRWVRGIVRRTLLPALRRSAAEKTDWTGQPDHEVLASVVYCVGRKKA